MKRITYEKNDRGTRKILERGLGDVENASAVVAPIIAAVRRRGDAALVSYTKRLDRISLKQEDIKVSAREMRAAEKRADKTLVSSLKHATRNITRFHREQLRRLPPTWSTTVEEGVVVGEKRTPIDSVGCYVPGGLASYPSSVLMTVIPAKVAGVKRVVVVSPPPIGDLVLAACRICGVDEVYRVGGAQAVAALAYGTKKMRPVSKIVGPGNKYVTAAKSLCYGRVDIDMPAGPSEVLILADASADPRFVAADLLAQAEHDPDAACVVASTSAKVLDETRRWVLKEKKTLERQDVLGKSLKNIALVDVKSERQLVEFANRYGAEHLEIMTRNAAVLEKMVTNAGAIFIGPFAPVPAGDYASGANHVLPTSGTSRFSSPLSVRDFVTYTSVQKISKKGLANLKDAVITLATCEGLDAHAQAVEERFL